MISVPSAPERVLVNGNHNLVESLRFDEASDTLTFVDIETGELLSHHPELDTAVPIADWLSFAQKGADGGYVLAAHDKIGYLYPGSSSPTWSMPLIDARRRFNDGIVDSYGRLIIGTMSLTASDNKNSLLFFKEDGSVHSLCEEIGLSNGLAICVQSNDLFAVDSSQHKIVRYRYSASIDSFSGPEMFHRYQEGEIPDGIILTKSGVMLVALWGKSEISIISPDGTEERRLSVPERFLTSLSISSRQQMLYVGYASEPRDNSNRETPGGVLKMPTDYEQVELFNFKVWPLLRNTDQKQSCS